MRSKKELKKILAEGMRHKARVHIGRYGIRPRVLWVYRHAWEGVPHDPTPTDVIRVKVHPGCTMSIEQIVYTLTSAYPSEYVGACGKNLIFVSAKKEWLTVGGLIDKLSEFPGDLPVLCDDDIGTCEVCTVENKIIGKKEVCWLDLVWSNNF